MTSDRHIVLIGPMGSGKTTIGRLLAGRLDRPFVDNDGVLEDDDRPQRGGDRARRRGRRLARGRSPTCSPRRSTRRSRRSITAAASTVLDPELRDRLRAESFVIWLTADPADLARRTTGSSTRPGWLPIR